MLLGWQTIGAHEYYLEPSGTAGVLGKAAKGFRTIDGNTYYFQVAGAPGQPVDRSKAAFRPGTTMYIHSTVRQELF